MYLRDHPQYVSIAKFWTETYAKPQGAGGEVGIFLFLAVLCIHLFAFSSGAPRRSPFNGHGIPGGQSQDGSVSSERRRECSGRGTSFVSVAYSRSSIAKSVFSLLVVQKI